MCVTHTHIYTYILYMYVSIYIYIIMDMLQGGGTAPQAPAAGLPDIDPSAPECQPCSREEVQKQKAMDETARRRGTTSGVIHSAPFFHGESKGNVDSLKPLAAAMLHAIFNRYAGGAEALDQDAVEAWLSVNSGEASSPAEASAFLAQYGTTEAEISRGDFLQYYCDSAKMVPQQTWKETPNPNPNPPTPTLTLMERRWS
jgi:hypothetical protein